MRAIIAEILDIFGKSLKKSFFLNFKNFEKKLRNIFFVTDCQAGKHGNEFYLRIAGRFAKCITVQLDQACVALHHDHHHHGHQELHGEQSEGPPSGPHLHLGLFAICVSSPG